MQFMPSTGRKYGVSAASSPEEQIEAGAVKLGKDWSYYSEIKDETQRIKFILAAYNGGSGKLATARKLAQKNGLDPNLWEENVELMIRGRSIGYYVKSVYSKYLYYKYLEHKE
jgi:membrane-bound lytic murein transglycosylase F